MTLPRLPLRLAALGLAAGIVALAGCDTGISGDPDENRPPDTQLAVRDSSLVDNICGTEPAGAPCDDDDELLASTVFVSWAGTDPDGFVDRFELRFFPEGAAGPEWSSTTRRDTLVLLPIPEGERTANVVFEVRAVDDDGAVDPTPARTVFPIQNAPPSVRLQSFDLPADTTWTLFSFAWEGNDPEGEETIQAFEVAFNDTTEFVRLPGEAEFATFVAAETGAGQTESPARVFLGRGFVSTELTVPGLLLDADNVFYLRAVDATGATSPIVRYPDPDLEQTFYVRQPTSDVLLVNDYRSRRDVELLPFHRDVLGAYLGGAGYDEWDLSEPDGSGGDAGDPGDDYADAIPPNADPTLRELLQLWDYVYWITDGVTDRVRGNNLALAATVIDGFFAQGGKLFVMAPLDAPQDIDADIDNPAFDILPVEALVVGEDGAIPTLRIDEGDPVVPLNPVPGTGRELPALQPTQTVTGTLPFIVPASRAVSLYRADYYVPLSGGQQEDWTGSELVAAIDLDRRVGFVGLQFYERNELRFVGTDGSEQAPRLAIQYILEGLGFPGQPEDG